MFVFMIIIILWLAISRSLSLSLANRFTFYSHHWLDKKHNIIKGIICSLCCDQPGTWKLGNHNKLET